MVDAKEYLKMAYRAATKSPDPSTQNGAVIVSNMGVVLAEDCNRFPNRVKVTDERLQRPLKYNFIEHAERNVILKAAKMQHPLLGSTMYVPWFACSDCARAIIGVGVRKVVGHKKMLDGTPDHWKESIAHAFVMLKESGVETEWFDGDIGGSKILFNGSWFQP